jgi:hypothetical protein
MKQYIFTEKVREHFRYLIDDYGFSVIREQHAPETFGNGLVEFQSKSAHIRVILDKGQVLIDLAPYQAIQDYWFDLSSVIEYLAPQSNEPVYVFPETAGNSYETIDWQVSRLAGMLRQHCVPVLKGEFSQWQELFERSRNEADDLYRALTGKVPLKGDSDDLQREIERRRRG